MLTYTQVFVWRTLTFKTHKYHSFVEEYVDILAILTAIIVSDTSVDFFVNIKAPKQVARKYGLLNHRHTNAMIIR